jgi:hypothetical protein
MDEIGGPRCGRPFVSQLQPRFLPIQPRSGSPSNRIGWRVTELRSDFDVPVLWRVTIGRYDGGVLITAIAADPDDALDELARYAAVGEDER